MKDPLIRSCQVEFGISGFSDGLKEQRGCRAQDNVRHTEMIRQDVFASIEIIHIPKLKHTKKGMPLPVGLEIRHPKLDEACVLWPRRTSLNGFIQVSSRCHETVMCPQVRPHRAPLG